MFCWLIFVHLLPDQLIYSHQKHSKVQGLWRLHFLTAKDGKWLMLVSSPSNHTIKDEPEILRVTTSSHAPPTHVQTLSVPPLLSWEGKQVLSVLLKQRPCWARELQVNQVYILYTACQHDCILADLIINIHYTSAAQQIDLCLSCSWLGKPTSLCMTRLH